MNDEVDYLLSFVTNTNGGYLAIHTDLKGVNLLINTLQTLRRLLEVNDCPHIHLFSRDCGNGELTTTKLSDQSNENNVVHEIKIYGWNEEWAIRHGLKPTTLPLTPPSPPATPRA